MVRLAKNRFAYLRNANVTAIYVNHRVSSDVTETGNYYAVQRTWDAQNHDHDLIYAGHLGAGQWEGEIFGAYLEPGDAGLVPLYNCHYATNYFVSRMSDCEGTTRIGLIGYVWGAANAGSDGAIYRCYAPVDHFVSKASDCEGPSVTEKSVLGYSARPF